MKGHKFHLKASDFKKIHSKLKQVEANDKSFKIKGLPISSFIIGNLSINDEVDSAQIRTKRIILQIAGDFSTKPEQLKDSLKLEFNLHYGENEYSLLQMRLNSLVKEYKKTASVTDTEASDCESVGDCTELVDSKIK